MQTTKKHDTPYRILKQGPKRVTVSFSNDSFLLIQNELLNKKFLDSLPKQEIKDKNFLDVYNKALNKKAKKLYFV